MFLLDDVGDFWVGSEAHCEVVCDVVAADGDDGDELEVAFLEDGDAGRGGAEVDDCDAVFDLALTKDGAGGGDWGWDYFFDFDLGKVGDLFEILAIRGEGGDDVCFDLEARADHADWVFDVTLAVEAVAVRDCLEDFAVSGDFASGGDFVDAVEVGLGDFGVDGDHAISFDARDVGAVDADSGLVDFVAAHAFCFSEGVVDGSGWAV